MGNRNLHIAIAESSELIQLGLKELISHINQPIHLHFADSFTSLQSILDQSKIDAVVVNPLLILNQEKAFQQLKSEEAGVKWIALQQGLFEESLLSQFDARISLYDAVESIQSIILHAVTDERSNEEMNRQPLSEREIEVLRLLVLGMSNKEIADKLFISTHTVISHRKNITQKTGIKSVSGLTIYAVVKGIISLNSVPD